MPSPASVAGDPDAAYVYKVFTHDDDRDRESVPQRYNTYSTASAANEAAVHAPAKILGYDMDENGGPEVTVKAGIATRVSNGSPYCNSWIEQFPVEGTGF